MAKKIVPKILKMSKELMQFVSDPYADVFNNYKESGHSE